MTASTAAVKSRSSALKPWDRKIASISRSRPGRYHRDCRLESGCDTYTADTRADPRPGPGLRLYAQEISEVRLGKPDGWAVGRLHPGAFVSVAASQEGVPDDAIRIALDKPFYDHPFFTRRAALGPARREV